MKKIGIVTLVGYFNYGNRLQNYALKKVLEKIGFEVDSLTFNKTPGFLSDLEVAPNNIVSKRIKKINLFKIFNKIKDKISNIQNKEEIEKANSIRTKEFMEFTNEFLSEVKFSNELEKDYSYFIVGSDQVWNPYYIKDMPEFFLPFTDDSKKIAYAASFGIPSLPETVENVFKNEINKFNHISVRENEGSKLIESLTGKSAQVVVDPTMLLSADEWSSILRRAKNRPDGKYILTYFLGGIDAEKSNVVKYFENKYNCPVINLGKKDEFVTYSTSPREFLDYIKNSTIFITDSFHGVVFSLIFEKEFIVFQRGNMNSRINTLLNSVGLESRKYINLKEEFKNISRIDYSRVKPILQDSIDKSMKFLTSNLKSNEERI